MSASHEEVESTLLWPADDEVPPGARDLAAGTFADLPGVARVEECAPVDLVAEYHDTPDLALLRGRLTLRRRTGGGDEGWHLKLPLEAGDERRLERQEPLDDGTSGPPRPFVALTRSRHRDRPLHVVATLRTRRRVLRLLGVDDVVLADVADDAVEADVAAEIGTPAQLSWREVEVELVDGDDDLLSAATDAVRGLGAVRSSYPSKLAHALADAGVHAGPHDADRPDGTAGVLLAAVREHRATLVAQDPMVRLDRPDSVHSMRVATRRLRSLLAAFRAVLADGAGEPLREELKWLGEVLGGPRDAEVLSARLEQRVRELPAGAARGPGPQAQLERVSGHGDVSAQDAVDALDGDRYLALLEALDRFVADPPIAGRTGRRRGTRRAARKAYRRVAGALEDVPDSDGPGRDAALHEVRKAAKRLRYTCEAVVPVHGRRARRLASRAEDLQELLGEHQDSVGARALLERAAEQARQAGEDTFALGVMLGLEQAGAQHGLRDLDRVTRRLHRAAARWFG